MVSLVGLRAVFLSVSEKPAQSSSPNNDAQTWIVAVLGACHPVGTHLKPSLRHTDHGTDGTRQAFSASSKISAA